MEAEPGRFDQEREAMGAVARAMNWVDTESGMWIGEAPLWPFERQEPGGLRDVVHTPLRLAVSYRQGFPMVQPILYPIDPDPPIERRVLHKWHLNGDGSLCLLRDASLWTGSETAADLVVKAAGWVIEYRLVEAGRLDVMTENGIYSDDSLDSLLE